MAPLAPPPGYAYVFTLHVAWPKRVGIYSIVQKDEREEYYKKVENR